MTIENLSRRDILRGMGLGSGLVLGFHVGFRSLPAWAAPETQFAPNVYVSIEESGMVTIVAHRSEMGTGIKTGLPMVLADELEADWNRVKIVQADGDIKYGDQNTDGSRSMRQFYQPLREAGAVARQMLEEAAARVWNVDPASCHAQNHAVVHEPTRRQLGFGELVKVAADLPLPSADHMELRFKPASTRRYVGKPVPIVDLADIVRGRATYGIDVVVPGMKYASIERCPVYGGRARSFDAKDAAAVPGVEKIIELEATPIPSGFDALGGIAVVASNTWAAQQGREKLKIAWDYGPNAGYDTTAYRAELEATAKRPGSRLGRLFRAALRARPDGSADCGRACDRRPLRGLGADPKPARRQNGRRPGARFRRGPGDPARHLAGRRIRPEVEARLRRRSGIAVAEARRAGQGDLDPAGRHPARLLSHDLRSAPRSGTGCRGSHDGVAASDRVSADRGDVSARRDLWQRRRIAARHDRHAL